MKILAIGDVVGKAGLSVLRRRLRDFKREKQADFVIVNGENTAGVGITRPKIFLQRALMSLRWAIMFGINGILFRILRIRRIFCALPIWRRKRRAEAGGFTIADGTTYW